MRRATQQVIGREAKTTAFIVSLRVKPQVVASRSRPRQCRPFGAMLWKTAVTGSIDAAWRNAAHRRIRFLVGSVLVIVGSMDKIVKRRN